MPTSLDQYVGVHAAALDVRARRTELIANNLANADTPGFKARDLDFRAAMARAAGDRTTGGVHLTTTQAGHIGGAASADATTSPDLKYRTPLAPALDGNTVDTQLEQTAFAEASVRYQASLDFLDARIQGLQKALRGD